MSKNKILTTHVGSLPRTKALLQANMLEQKRELILKDMKELDNQNEILMNLRSKIMQNSKEKE